MPRKIEAVAAFGLTPCRKELFLMVNEFPNYSVRAVVSGGETCGHHRNAPSLTPGRSVARFVAALGVGVVFCADYVEATGVSIFLPDDVACLPLPPRAAFAVPTFAVPAFALAPRDAGVDSEVSAVNIEDNDAALSRIMFCAESRARNVFRALAFHDAVHNGGGGAGGAAGQDPCVLCLLGRGAENPPSEWCSTGACDHRFHVACLLEWLEVRSSCPSCLCPIGASENLFLRRRYA